MKPIIYVATIIACAIAAIFSFVGPIQSQSPTPTGIRIHEVVPTETEDNAVLDVFFTLVDQEGQPDVQTDISAAQIEVTGIGKLPIDATVGRVSPPYYVALLFDQSISMQGGIAQMREIAINIVESSPSNAHFAVYGFSEEGVGDEVKIIQDFTDQKEWAKTAIIGVQAQTSNATCLYNSLRTGIGKLQSISDFAYERRALVLFSDGKDETQQLQPCSSLTSDAIIALADSLQIGPNKIVSPMPIYTAGPCDLISCNQQNLNDLAFNTGGFSLLTINNQNDPVRVFKPFLDSLATLWRAQAWVEAPSGTNNGMLIVQVDGSNQTLVGHDDFVFRLGREAIAQCKNTGSGFDLQPVTEEWRYVLTLKNLQCPEEVGAISVGIYDKEAGGNKIGEQIDLEVTENQPLLLPYTINLIPTAWTEGASYWVRVDLFDREGLRFENEEGGSIALPIPFENLLASAPDIYFEIRNIFANFSTEKLRVTLAFDPANGESRVDEVDVTIRNSQNEEFTLGRIDYESKLFEVDMPETMWSLGGTQTYFAAVEVFEDLEADQDRSYKNINADYSFPAKRPNILYRIVRSMRKNPLGPLVFLLGLAGVVIYLLVQKIQSSKQKEPVVRPVANPETAVQGGLTQSIPPPAPAKPKVNIKLQITIAGPPDDSAPVQVEVANFPCILGRDKNLTQGKLDVRGGKQFVNVGKEDGNISRRHVEITLSSGQLFLTALKSTNGTFIDGQRLPEREQRLLVDKTEIRLGRRTRLALEPLK